MSNITVEDKLEFLKQARSDPIFFCENLLFNEDLEPYKLEEFQKKFLRCHESYRQLFFARRLGKSTILRFDILHKSFFIPNFNSLVIQPTWPQAIRHGEEIQNLIRRSPLIGSFFEKANVTTMLLKNSSRLSTASAGNDAVSQLGRGARYLGVDEAQQIPDKVYGFILPIMRGTPGKKWQTFCGTPLGKMGLFWEIYNNAKMYINRDGVRKIEIDSYTGDRFVVFEHQTCYLDAEGNIVESGTNRLTISELMTDRSLMSEFDFLREYCLEWMDTVGEVFPSELIESCELTGKNDTAQMSSTAECCAGVDFGKQRHNSVITIGEREQNGKIKIIFYHDFPLGTTYKEVANYCCNILPKRFPNIRKMVVDKTGVGDAVIELFEEGVQGTGIKVEGFNFSGQDKKRGLVEAAVLEMEQGKVKFVHNTFLKNEMLAYKRVINDKTNQITYSKPRNGTDDYLDSFMLCLAANRGTLSPIGDFNVISAGAKILDRFGHIFEGQKKRINPRQGNIQYGRRL